MRVGDLVKHIYSETYLPELNCGVVVKYKKELDYYLVFWYGINRIEDETLCRLEVISESRRSSF